VITFRIRIPLFSSYIPLFHGPVSYGERGLMSIVFLQSFFVDLFFSFDNT
jgi:hypothetical protein